MKVVLPEKKSIKTKDWILYSVIIIICIVSIVAVYREEFKKVLKIGESSYGQKSEEETKRLVADFDKLYTNQIKIINGNGDYKLLDEQKDIVYTDFEKVEKTDNYDINIKIPRINIDDKNIQNYNEQMNKSFIDKAESIQKNENTSSIYTIEYVANIHNDVLSLMIRSNLKEGSSPQRVIVQTYTYDLKNKEEITLEKLIEKENLDKDKIQSNIKETINQRQEQVKSLRDLGYKIYSRDSSSSIYEIKNSTEFYVTDKTLYIVYAYGNTKSTSEIDIVVI